ncbi:RDD family protein [Parvularcula sp. ZS-1/3]|uniref:RDD family protein n=1 Tax=Parvularcula mediterranea TaxID=2732508 RepID=A0A7Y3RNG3_9PROT|nr:RDD family protein [Parvularcula mediterranea]NNU17308.1 RDD family protein [Parvularcula mediterranea]
MKAWPLRRLTAYAVDSMLIMLLVAALLFINLVLLGASFADGTGSEPWRAHLIGFLSLTLPVVLYFAGTEAAFGATLGKKLLGLEVSTTEGTKPGAGAAFLRNVVKFLPWEINHMAMWYVPEGHRLFIDPMPTLNTGVQVACLLAGLAYVLTLFIGSGRTPYDRIAKTVVAKQ